MWKDVKVLQLYSSEREGITVSRGRMPSKLRMRLIKVKFHFCSFAGLTLKVRKN